MKKIVLLGATGSIGNSTLDVLRAHSNLFKLELICAYSNIDKLVEIAEEFDVPNIVLINKNVPIPDSKISGRRFYHGSEELYSLLHDINADIVLNAISGSAGLQSSMISISRGFDLALANKESLVMAGHLVAEELKHSQSRLLPVDSEHSAILQCLGQTPGSEVEKLIITASGGPFRQRDLKTFDKITLKDTLKHPTWNMGTKITIDSATMMNKGLEVIEAHWLFNLPYEQITALIHPQSIIHSIVEFKDGSNLAQMGKPNMSLPILYALTYPNHISSDISKTDFLKLNSLTFEPLDKRRYPLYYLGLEVGKLGGLLPTVMNAANEAAIKLFIDNKIRFINIYEVVEKYVSKADNVDRPDLETILKTNREIYDRILIDYK